MEGSKKHPLSFGADNPHTSGIARCFGGSAVEAGADGGGFGFEFQHGRFVIGIDLDATVSGLRNSKLAQRKTFAGHAPGGTLQRQGERSVGVGLVGDPCARRLTREQPRGLAGRRGERRVFHREVADIADGKLVEEAD